MAEFNQLAKIKIPGDLFETFSIFRLQGLLLMVPIGHAASSKEASNLQETSVEMQTI